MCILILFLNLFLILNNYFSGGVAEPDCPGAWEWERCQSVNNPAQGHISPCHMHYLSVTVSYHILGSQTTQCSSFCNLPRPD